MKCCMCATEMGEIYYRVNFNLINTTVKETSHNTVEHYDICYNCKYKITEFIKERKDDK